MKLFDLCSDILIDVVTLWLPFEKDFGAFDSSLTNKDLRVEYLSLIHLDHCIFSVCSCRSAWFEWILLRGIYISSVFLDKSVHYDRIDEVMKREQKSIQFLSVHGMSLKLLGANSHIDFNGANLFGGLINLTCLEIKSDHAKKILDVIPRPERLKELSLSTFYSESLSAAALKCINLEKLTLNWKNADFYGFDGHFSKLRELTLDCPCEILNSIIKGSQNITKLSICSRYSGDYSSLQSLTSLESLSYISFNEEFDSYIINIVSNNKRLINLSAIISNANDVISAISQHCISFERLSIECVYLISNDVLTNFVNKFSSLICLSLTYSGVNNEFVEALSRNCLNLEELILFDDANFTDEFVMMVTRGCVNLRTLNLTYSKLLTDKSILHISANCGQLVNLSLCVDCISIEVFKIFATSCPLLKFVHMYAIRYHIPPVAFNCLSNMRKDLVFFFMSKCIPREY